MIFFTHNDIGNCGVGECDMPASACLRGLGDDHNLCSDHLVELTAIVGMQGSHALAVAHETVAKVHDLAVFAIASQTLPSTRRVLDELLSVLGIERPPHDVVTLIVTPDMLNQGLTDAAREARQSETEARDIAKLIMKERGWLR